MNPQPNNLDELLASLERDEPTSPHHEQAVRTLGSAIHATLALPDDAPHFSLTQLGALVQAKQAAGHDWEVPPHLSSCPICLDLFAALIEGVPPAPAETLDRFIALRPAPIPTPALPPRALPFSPAWRLAAAACAALALGGGAMLFLHKSSDASLESGGLRLANSPVGSTVKTGNKLPADTLLEASEETFASLPDGSRLALTPKTRFEVKNAADGNTTIDFKFGQLTASVAHQQPGTHFFINTPLGRVTVVGTKFTVTSHSETVTMFNSDGSPHNQPVGYDANVKAIVVQVQEGIVQVNNARDQARVPAGKTAILRDQSPIIEVLEK